MLLGYDWVPVVAIYVSVGSLTILMLALGRWWPICDTFRKTQGSMVRGYSLPEIDLQNRLFEQAEMLMANKADGRGACLIVGDNSVSNRTLQIALQDIGLTAMSCCDLSLVQDWADDLFWDESAGQGYFLVIDARAGVFSHVTDLVREVMRSHINVSIIIIAGFPTDLPDDLRRLASLGRIICLPASVTALRAAILSLMDKAPNRKHTAQYVWQADSNLRRK